MAGRALAFADAGIQKLVRERFVPVAADDWFQRRREDAEGEFFRKVADQSPRKGVGGDTRQGIYCLTADGELLSYRNAGQNAQATRDALEAALAKWRKLPERRKRPGAVRVGDPGSVDERFDRTPPEGTQIVRVFTRVLDKEGDGWRCAKLDREWGSAAARDHLWVTKDDLAAIATATADVKAGDRVALPAKLARRIVRFHLMDNTRGEPPYWTEKDVERADLAFVVRKAEGARVEMQATGTVLLRAGKDAATAQRGFDAAVAGPVEFDREAKKLTRFDLTVVGDHWGEATFTRGARPGRTPLGMAFVLTDDPIAAAIAPHASREIGLYLGRY